jgi:hypothetical protein
MFTNLLFNRTPLRRRVVRRPVYRPPVVNQYGGKGNDIFYNTITVTTCKPSPVPVTVVTTPTYTATVRDYFLCVDHAGLVTITLPFGVLGTVYIIKDCSGNAFDYPITIQGLAQTVDGGVAEINTNFGSITVIFNGTEWSIV